MDRQFRLLVAKEARPFTIGTIQMMKRYGLVRSLGDESTSDCSSIRINLQSESNDKEKVCAVLIPGIQGVATSEWYTFGASLSTPTYLIPLMKSKDVTSVEAIAKSIIGTVSACFANQKQFYIVGYSFGAIVSLYLASMLEQTGKFGRVLLIDGSTTYLQRTIESFMTTCGTSEKNVENVLILLLYFSLCSTGDTYDFIDQLQNYDKWPKKIDLLERYLPDTVLTLYPKQYLHNLITAMSNRMKSIILTNADDSAQFVKLKSLVTLVRPTHTTIQDIEKDYNLQKYCEQTIDVRYIEGNYTKIFSTDEVTQIVDKFAPIE